ncbi:O-methyltransferase domain-containing protein 2 [Elsinoe fawcettii]|nr:O-methyltransferase domain-containing protein 2 [Elsinoe fawcettii]
MAGPATLLDSYAAERGFSSEHDAISVADAFRGDTPQEVVEAASEMKHLLSVLEIMIKDSEQRLRDLIHNPITNLASLRVCMEYGVFDLIPDAGIATQTLVQKCGINSRADQLSRFVKHLHNRGVLRLSSDCIVGHTPTSRRLTKQSSLRGEVEWFLTVAFESLALLPTQLRNLGSEEPGRSNSAFNMAFKTELPVMEWVEKKSKYADAFASMMRSYAGQPCFSVEHTLKALDSVGLEAGLLVDVGGGTGAVVQEIAKRFPALRFVVQDQAKAIRLGKEHLPSSREDTHSLKDRISLEQHDFFEVNPIHEPNAFLLRWILHDWPDDEALRIINAIGRSMGENTRLFILDNVAGQDDASAQERDAESQLDIIMMGIFNGVERSKEQWQRLIHRTEPLLSLRNTIRPVGSALSLMVLQRQPSSELETDTA